MKDLILIIVSILWCIPILISFVISGLRKKLESDRNFYGKEISPKDIELVKVRYKPIDMKASDFSEYNKDGELQYFYKKGKSQDVVYAISKHMIDEKGLRIIRNGLLLGELKKNRFEPSQALAMALKKEQYNNCIDLKLSDERVIKYLKGETIDVDDFPDSKGWALVCVDGYPLGWGKSNGSQLKNKYLAGWRWM